MTLNGEDGGIEIIKGGWNSSTEEAYFNILDTFTG
jgi:hypothetical protein